MSAPVVVVVTIPDENHFALLQILIAGLVQEGAVVHVLGDRRNAAAVERAGATFVDLYGRCPLDAADDESVPQPSRFVTYAARYAEDVVAEVRTLAPDVVVHDVFAVIGRVVARALDVPRAAVFPGHDLDGRRFAAELEGASYVSTGGRCRAAVQELRERYAIEDASPFSYLVDLDPELVVSGEPRAFLVDDERRAGPSTAFYGSLPGDALARAARARGRRGAARGTGAATRVLVSFGTIIWRYFAREALAALTAVADTVEALDGVEATVTLGGATLSPSELAAVERPGVRVRRWVDQWAELGAADAFVTHHGVASTHEAIVLGVPMLSVPFFVDQPRRAARCQELGLASSLVDGPGGPVSAGRLREALAGLAREAPARRAAFDRARRWERETLAGRPSVHRRILALSRPARALD